MRTRAYAGGGGLLSAGRCSGAGGRACRDVWDGIRTGAPAALRPGPERFTKFNWNHFEKDMAVQVQSAVILLKRFLPKMAKLPRGRVVFMLSSYVHGVPPKYMTMYTTVKYAQLGLMRSLEAEYAGTPVRVNAVSPSMVETQFLRDLPETVVQMNAQANPLGRNATPAEPAGERWTCC